MFADVLASFLQFQMSRAPTVPLFTNMMYYVTDGYWSTVVVFPRQVVNVSFSAVGKYTGIPVGFAGTIVEPATIGYRRLCPDSVKRDWIPASS